GQLGRLERKRAQMDPAARAAGCFAHHRHRDQQSHRRDIKGIRITAERAVVERHHRRHRDSAGCNPNELSNHQRMQRMTRTGIGRAEHGYQSDQRDRYRENEYGPVEVIEHPAVELHHTTPLNAPLSGPRPPWSDWAPDWEEGWAPGYCRAAAD